MRAKLLPLVALLALAGCKKSDPAPTSIKDDPSAGALPADHPPVDLPPTSRGPRRLSVDQLLASVYTVASDDGSIRWSNDRDSSRRTLGKPDYLAVTDEDLTPSTLYMKFVDDIANDVCGQMISSTHRTQVLMKYAGVNDTLQSNPTAVKTNLRYLYLRYFGRHVDSTDDATIQPLLTVFDKVTRAGALPDAGSLGGNTPAVEGWRAVCLAAFTSPEFHIY